MIVSITSKHFYATVSEKYSLFERDSRETAGGNLSNSSHSSLLDIEFWHDECAICTQSHQGIHLQCFCRVCITKNYVKMSRLTVPSERNNTQNSRKNENMFTASKQQNTLVRKCPQYVQFWCICCV